jgi:biopolymer transport protein TolR
MSRGKKGRRLMGQMNVVPYIDVMLVLLIIFMVTAPMLQQGVTVDLPDVEAAPIEVTEDNEPLVVSMNADSELFMNLDENPDAPVTEERLLNATAIILRRNPDTPVLIKADESLDFGRVLRMTALLKKAGATQLGYLSETPEDLPEIAPEEVPPE